MTQTFRKVFSLPDNNVLRWFPGHMSKAINRMQASFKDTDCIVEIHDARIPVSGRNPKFSDMIKLRPHVLLLNKVDLCDSSLKNKTVATLQQKYGVENILFTNSSEFKSNVIKRDLIPMVMKAIDSRPRYKQTDLDKYNIMVIGVPNTGKSTFINAVRRMHTTKQRSVVRSGSIAGITRGVNNPIKVHFDPDISLIDTPGILTPSIPNIEAGMRLSLCGCLTDYLVGEHYIVDYMLYWLNKHGHFSYLEKFELTKPTENVMSFLSHVAKKHKLVQQIRDIDSNSREMVMKPNFQQAAQTVLRSFRSGELGKFTIDKDML